MSAEPPPTPPTNPPDEDPERPEGKVQLHNVIERVRNQFARTLVLRSSRSRKRKAASRADSEVAPEDAAGPSQQSIAEPGPSATPPPQESIAATAQQLMPLPSVELVPDEYALSATLDVDDAGPPAEGYLVPEMAERITPRGDSLLEADPDMMDQEFTAEDFAVSSAAAAARSGMSRTDRARTLFERYGVPYDDVTGLIPNQDGRPDSGLRVHSRIRMRVRYSCHVCDTTFRHERACRQCSHARCDACPRMLPHRRAQELRIQRRLMAERLARRSRSPDETLPDMDEMDRLHET